MKRSAYSNWPALIGVGIAMLISVVWFLFMTYVNSRTDTLHVQVSGTIDEVDFYLLTNPDQSVATITTHGQDTQSTVKLAGIAGLVWLVQAKPAQYYFIAKQGEQTYQSRVFCCQSGLMQARLNLIIRGLKEWEVSAP